jgi:hypothetical protein
VLQVIRIRGGFEILKHDKKVKVTGLRVKLAGSCGAEQFQSPNVVTAAQLFQFITILCNGGNHELDSIKY